MRRVAVVLLTALVATARFTPAAQNAARAGETLPPGGALHSNVRSFWPYLVVCGTLSWIALYREGLHPAFALVPIVPFLPHEPRRLDLLADPPDDDAVHRFEHEWDTLVQGILFLFGLVNGGVLLRGYDTGTWALLLGALVGRPLGILAAVGMAIAAGWHLRGASVGMAIAAGWHLRGASGGVGCSWPRWPVPADSPSLCFLRPAFCRRGLCLRSSRSAHWAPQPDRY